MPRFLIVGAGAIGGFIGAVLSRDPSYDVVMVARGTHLAAMKNDGLHITLDSLSKKPERFVAKRLGYAGNLREASGNGPFDVVFLCVKAHQLIDIARDPSWKSTLHDKTLIVPMQNGIPWYIFLTRPRSDQMHGTRLKSVDPDGELERAFDSWRIVGCIAMPACTLVQPGHIDHEHGWTLPLPATESSRHLASLLSTVGLQPKCFENFEEELWVKSLGSAVFNPVSALTGATLGEFAADSKIVGFTYKLMDEVRTVAASVGITVSVSNERRLKGAVRIGDHKTSMLQDVEAGKAALELDALVSSVVEVASITRTPVPMLEAVQILVAMKQRSLARQAKVQAKI